MSELRPEPSTAAAGEQNSGQTEAVLRNSALMAVGTITSRVTGVLRDIAIAAALGSALVADTYAVGNSLPNIIYILVIGGALNAVFIPQLMRHMKSDADGGDGYADRLITLVGLLLLGLSVLAVLLAPLIVGIYTSNDFGEADTALAVAFARYCLPQILFYGLFTMFSQVLNSRLRFGAPMFAPIVNNIVMIATAGMFIWLVAGAKVTTSSLTPGQVALLGIGTTAGVAAQALVLVPALIRAGYRYRPRFDFRGHGLGKAGSLAGWTIGLVLVNQLGFLVVVKLATHANVIASNAGLVDQGLATYQRALLVFMLPHSVITISLVTALYPRMSRAAAEGHLSQVASDVTDGVRLIGSLIIPFVTALVAFGPLVGTIAFGVGQNEGAPATYTGVVVSVFALGLLPYTLFYTLLRGWYSVEDTRTPFLVTVIYNVIAMPLTVGLFVLAPDQVKVASLALAYGLAYWLTLGVTWWLLSRRLGGLHSAGTITALIKMGVCGIVAAVLGATCGYGGYALFTSNGLGHAYTELVADRWACVAVLAIGGVVTVGAYLGLAALLRIPELREMIATVRTRIGR